MFTLNVGLHIPKEKKSFHIKQLFLGTLPSWSTVQTKRKKRHLWITEIHRNRTRPNATGIQRSPLKKHIFRLQRKRDSKRKQLGHLCITAEVFPVSTLQSRDRLVKDTPSTNSLPRCTTLRVWSNIWLPMSWFRNDRCWQPLALTGHCTNNGLAWKG